MMESTSSASGRLFTGKIEHDLSKPDGTPRKLMSCARLHALGWQLRIKLRDGLVDAYTAPVAEQGYAFGRDATIHSGD